MSQPNVMSKLVHTTLGHCHQRESAYPGMFHKWECTNLMWSGLDERGTAMKLLPLDCLEIMPVANVERSVD